MSTLCRYATSTDAQRSVSLCRLLSCSDVAHWWRWLVHTQFETADRPKTVCLSKLSADQGAGRPGWEVVEVPQEVGLHAFRVRH